MAIVHSEFGASGTNCANTFHDISKVLELTRPFLDAVDAGPTQQDGTARHAETAGLLAKDGLDMVEKYDQLFADLNAAAKAAKQGGELDAADDKTYHG